jgi:hypothetical protein
MSSPAVRTLSLTNAALSGLKMILASTEWLKNDAEATKHTFRAGQILEEVLPDAPPFKPELVTNARGEKELKEGENERAVLWEKTMLPEFNVSERQFETIKKAIDWAVKTGQLPNGRHKNLLIRQAGLEPTDG